MTVVDICLSSACTCASCGWKSVLICASASRQPCSRKLGCLRGQTLASAPRSSVQATMEDAGQYPVASLYFDLIVCDGSQCFICESELDHVQ